MSHIPLDDRGGDSILHTVLKMHVRELVEKIGRRAALNGLVGKLWEHRDQFPPDHPIQQLIARYNPETGIVADSEFEDDPAYEDFLADDDEEEEEPREPWQDDSE